MIIDKIIKVRTNPSNYNHYKEKGYLINKCGEDIEIKINDLPVKSHVKVNCKCSKCNSTTYIKYHNYMKQSKDSYYVCKNCWSSKLKDTIISKYGVENIRFLDHINKKIEETNISKYGVKYILDMKGVRNLVKKYYGVENISQSEEIKEIKRNKSLEKFGTNTPLQNKSIIEIIRLKHIESGRWSDYNEKDFSNYRKKVDYLTKKNKNQLYKNWNGLDYYDDENIRENLKLDNNHNRYPSIDHKVSVLFGFLNSISYEEIADISNLCITKRFINSKKFTMNDIDFVTKKV